MRRIKTYIILSALLVLPGFFTSSCETNQGEIIPYVKVDEYFLIYSDLYDLGVLETKFVKGGVNGLVIYREADQFYRAFDRTCTMWPEHNAAVDDNGLALECPECGSIFIPSLEGMPDSKSGPAIHPLIEYNAVLSGDVLHVFN